MNVVLDTNIVVSALISPFGAPARIVELVLAGEIQPAFDDRVMAEYREVLSRARFGFDSAGVEDLLDFIQAEGVAVITTPWPHALPDPDDRAFVEVAAAAEAILITGNLRHFPEAGCPGIVVMAPADFHQCWHDQEFRES